MRAIISANLQDGGRGEHVRFDHMLESRDEGPIARELLIPPPEGG
jgi:hypothetical protein